MTLPRPGLLRGNSSVGGDMVKARHIAIRVQDMERALKFYRDTLGLTFVRTRKFEGQEAVDLSDGETNITLLPAQGNPGLDHIGFVVDDVKAVYERLKQAGAKPDKDAPAEFFKVQDPDQVIVDIASVRRGW